MHRALTSREYKLMLSPTNFFDFEKGTNLFWELFAFLAERAGAETKRKKKPPKQRKTYYLDTALQGLRKNDFICRIREEMGDNEPFKTTLKYRHSDRYLAAYGDVRCKKRCETKFEEDLLPPFRGKFSLSASVRTTKEPSFAHFENLMDWFPGLQSLALAAQTPLQRVANFTAFEQSLEMGKIRFADGEDVKVVVSAWFPKPGKTPLVVECSFDFDAEANDSKDVLLERFHVETVAGSDHLFHALQKQAAWANLEGTTKTAFAYEGL